MVFRVVARELLWCLEFLVGSCSGDHSLSFSRVVARELLWCLEWLLGS